MLDGTHVKFDVKNRSDKSISKHQFRSTKSNTKDKYCVNFVVAQLRNGISAAVLYPLPCKRSDSQSIRSGVNTETKETNSQVLNRLFGRRDVATADGNFSPFTNDGPDCDLLTSEVEVRPIKPRKVDFPPVMRAMADGLSQERNAIERNFGYHKLRFEPLSSKRGQQIPFGDDRWVYNMVANTFALENIHCFPDYLGIDDCDPDHPFFKTDPTKNPDDRDLVQDLVNAEPLLEEAHRRLSLANDRDQRFRATAAALGVPLPPRARRFQIFDSGAGKLLQASLNVVRFF